MPDFTNISSETVYEGPRFTVYRGQFRHDDGQVVTREWITPGNVVAVLPYDDEGFWLARQPREIVGREVLSLCAGKIDPGEVPFEAAVRELREELGLVGPFWSLVASFHTSEGITDEHTTLFALKYPVADPEPMIDAGERIDVQKFRHEEIDALIANATNAKLLIGLQWLRGTLIHSALEETRDEVMRLGEALYGGRA